MNSDLLNQTLKHQHPDIEIPHGSLFYPCCGHDLRDPVRLFIDAIDEFHFVDLGFIPGFERIGYSKDDKLVPMKKDDAVILPESMILHVTDAVVTSTRPGDNSAPNHRKTFGWEQPCEHYQRWNVNTNPSREIAIHRHFADGLTTFHQIDKISVFFLRRDSMGEGGSGQMWFQKKLLRLILEKLVVGGLIVTDGSGRPDTEHPYCDDLPWSALWLNSQSSADKNKLPEDFSCFDRQFKCICRCGQGYGPVYAWQVSAK